MCQGFTHGGIGLLVTKVNIQCCFTVYSTFLSKKFCVNCHNDLNMQENHAKLHIIMKLSQPQGLLKSFLGWF